VQRGDEEVVGGEMGGSDDFSPLVVLRYCISSGVCVESLRALSLRGYGALYCRSLCCDGNGLWYENDRLRYDGTTHAGKRAVNQ